jgi:hypothetical protein
MASAREVLVIERVPELTAFFEKLVSTLGEDVHLTIERDADRAERLVATHEFDDVIHDEKGMLALVDRILRARRANAAVDATLAVDNRW